MGWGGFLLRKSKEAERDLQRKAKDGDREAIRRIQEREAIAEGIRKAAEEGRLGEVIDILTGAGDEEDEQGEDFEDFDEDNEDEGF